VSDDQDIELLTTSEKEQLEASFSSKHSITTMRRSVPQDIAVDGVVAKTYTASKESPLHVELEVTKGGRRDAQSYNLQQGIDKQSPCCFSGV
jgi:hypothetical protein